jgi:hypothetical protein
MPAHRAAWAVRGVDRQAEIRPAFDAAIGAGPPAEEDEEW